MSQLPGWMPELLALIQKGCAESPMFAISNDDQVFDSGKALCLSLWPFIRELPENIASVRKRTPSRMEAAAKLFGQLADEERVYQQLYLQQCQLAGISDEELDNVRPNEGALLLSAVIRRHCFAESYVDGVLSIVTAELAATAWSRSAEPVFDAYFTKHANLFQAQVVEEGLQWLRLHAKPNMKHAIWLRRLLGDLAQQTKEMPVPVIEVLQALYAVLQVEKQIPTIRVEELTLIS